jgi:hypothetical protein
MRDIASLQTELPCSTEAVVLAQRPVHRPGAAEARGELHQIACPEAHRRALLGGHGHIPLPQQACLPRVVGPGESANCAAPDRPGTDSSGSSCSAVGLGMTRIGSATGIRIREVQEESRHVD